jgi:hypothetical protein
LYRNDYSDTVRILITDSNKDESDSVRHVRSIVEGALKGSACADWRYNISHFSLSGG